MRIDCVKRQRDIEIRPDTLNPLLTILKAYDLLVNQIKCKRLGESADFSWFRVLPDKISSIASKIENLNGSEEPKNYTELRRIMGMFWFLIQLLGSSQWTKIKNAMNFVLVLNTMEPNYYWLASPGIGIH